MTKEQWKQPNTAKSGPNVTKIGQKAIKDCQTGQESNQKQSKVVQGRPPKREVTTRVPKLKPLSPIAGFLACLLMASSFSPVPLPSTGHPHLIPGFGGRHLRQRRRLPGRRRAAVPRPCAPHPGRGRIFGNVCAQKPPGSRQCGGKGEFREFQRAEPHAMLLMTLRETGGALVLRRWHPGLRGWCASFFFQTENPSGLPGLPLKVPKGLKIGRDRV